MAAWLKSRRCMDCKYFGEVWEAFILEKIVDDFYKIYFGATIVGQEYLYHKHCIIIQIRFYVILFSSDTLSENKCCLWFHLKPRGSVLNLKGPCYVQKVF